MNVSIHGHEVIQMMVESGATYTTQSLREAIHERFGSTARFHTCSADNLDADALILFLAERGKFVPADSGFSIDAGRVCGHGDHHH
jgi:probable metal-binding protein